MTVFCLSFWCFRLLLDLVFWPFKISLGFLPGLPTCCFFCLRVPTDLFPRLSLASVPPVGAVPIEGRKIQETRPHLCGSNSHWKKPTGTQAWHIIEVHLTCPVNYIQPIDRSNQPITGVAQAHINTLQGSCRIIIVSG